MIQNPRHCERSTAIQGVGHYVPDCRVAALLALTKVWWK